MSFYFLSTEKLTQLFLLNEFESSPDQNMTKLVPFHSLFPSLPIFAKARSRMTTAIAFSRQNDGTRKKHLQLRAHRTKTSTHGNLTFSLKIFNVNCDKFEKFLIVHHFEGNYLK